MLRQACAELVEVLSTNGENSNPVNCMYPLSVRLIGKLRAGELRLSDWRKKAS